MRGNRTTGRGCRMAIARRGFYPRSRGGSMRRGRTGWRASGFESGEGVGRVTVRGCAIQRNVTQCLTSLPPLARKASVRNVLAVTLSTCLMLLLWRVKPLPLHLPNMHAEKSITSPHLPALTSSKSRALITPKYLHKYCPPVSHFPSASDAIGRGLARPLPSPHETPAYKG